MSKRLWNAVRATWSRKRLDEEFEEELRSHFELATERYMEEGMSAAEAAETARRDFGSVTRTRERQRDARGLRSLENAGRDVRFGVRSLARRPLFSMASLLMLALGIGATSAVFGLVQGVILQAPPYEEPDELVLMQAEWEEGLGEPSWSAIEWRALRDESRSIEGLAAYGWTFSYLVSDEGSQSMEGMYVTEDYFDVLGVRPMLGGGFSGGTIDEGGPREILLGHDLWMNRFGGDPDLIGSTIRMSGRPDPYRVVGVMPAGLRFLPAIRSSQEPSYNVDSLVDFWILAVQPNDPAVQQRRSWDMIVRLRDGVTPAAAQAEFNTILSQLPPVEGVDGRVRAAAETMEAFLNRDGQRILYPLLIASFLVLLIACGNAAAMFLIRGLQRQREIGIRTAIGGGRLAMVRLVMIESVLLAVAGCALGIGLAAAIVTVFRSIGRNAIPRLDAVSLGWEIVAFGAAVALGSALLSAVFPARRAWRSSEAGSISGTGARASAGRNERRILRAVTTVQAGLTLALLVGAALLVRTMGNVADVDRQYDPTRLVSMTVASVDADWQAFHRTALDRVGSLPGVRRAAFAWGVPLTNNAWTAAVQVRGSAVADLPENRRELPIRSITSDYFAMFGRPIVQGRNIRPTDENGAPNVAVVNQAWADLYFPGASPLGRIIELPFGDPEYEIVGVVEDMRMDDLTRDAVPEIYVSLWQLGPFAKELLVQTGGDPMIAVGPIRTALQEIDPTVAVENVRTMDRIRSESVATRGFATRLLLGFAFVSTLLTLAGIYGVLSLLVATRKREFAIRSAIGAARANLVGLVYREGSWVIGSGLLIGLVVAAGLSRILGAFLFGVEPTDPDTLLGVAVLFCLITAVACWVPARRAAGVNPAEAIRES